MSATAPRPVLAALAVALLLLGLLAGCDERPADEPAPLLDPDGEPEAGPSPSVLRWAIAEPDGITPSTATNVEGLTVVNLLFTGLTRLDADLDVARGIADRWRVNDEGTLWTFVLRPAARFHDGSRVSAEAVVESWERTIREGRAAPHLADVVGYDDLVEGRSERLAGLTTWGDSTVQIRLVRPRSDLPLVLAHPSLAVQGPARSDGGQPVGSGPYALREEWVPGQFIRLGRVAVSGPGPQEVLFRLTDPTSGYIAFQQGRVDIATVPPGALAEAVARYGQGGRGQPGVHTDPSGAVYLLGMALGQPPFDEVEVRRALSFAVDRRALAESMPDGNAQPARGVTPSTVPGGAASACSTCLHAPTAAQRLFANHEIDRLELWVDDSGVDDTLASRLRRDLAAVGVTLDVVRVPTAELLDAIDAGTAPLYRFGWRVEHPTAVDLLVPLLHSSSSGVAAGNPGGFAQDEVDAFLDTALADPDSEAQTLALRAAEITGVGREQAVIPLLIPRNRLVVADRVEGFDLEPTGRADLTRVELDRGDEGG